MKKQQKTRKKTSKNWKEKDINLHKSNKNEPISKNLRQIYEDLCPFK